MPDKAIVINTGPLIALIAATGNLDILKSRYEKTRRIARLHDLRVTGSLGILLKAKSKGENVSIRQCISNMEKKGIYLSPGLISKAIQMSGE